jgi:hypothetical protein
MKMKQKYCRASSLMECLISLAILTCAVITYSAWIEFTLHETEHFSQQISNDLRHTNAGFCLLECMLSIALGIVIIAGCVSFFAWFHQVTLKLREVQIVTQEAMYLSLFFTDLLTQDPHAAKTILPSEVYNEMHLTQKKALLHHSVLMKQTTHATQFFFVAKTQHKTKQGETLHGLYRLTVGEDLQMLSEPVEDFQIWINGVTNCWQFNMSFFLFRANTVKTFSWCLCNIR